jgi:hypothetical protein
LCRRYGRARAGAAGGLFTPSIYSYKRRVLVLCPGLLLEVAGKTENLSFDDSPALRQFAPARRCKSPCLSAGGENERPLFNTGDRITRKHVRLKPFKNDVSHVVGIGIPRTEQNSLGRNFRALTCNQIQKRRSNVAKNIAGIETQVRNPKKRREPARCLVNRSELTQTRKTVYKPFL